ncbi:MAG: peptidoglycan bridge formation glycyltransferase FemA/FemB family protein [Candidatus Saganbacteria bacterium]|nr:peptidoglycan bridge formation glycyltransferase FemA/FemB family protein [Candidatus Saganbacteria bacterium]
MIKFTIMRIRHVFGQDRAAWNEFVSAASSEILQSYEWGEFKSKFGWEPIRIAIENDDGRIVAGISILKRKVPGIGSIFYAPRGPIIDFRDEEALDLLLTAVALEAKKHRAVYLKIDPEVMEEDRKALDILQSKGFIRKKKQIQPRTTFLIDITRPLPDILASFEEKTRYNIRLSQKKGVTVVDASNGEGIRAFYNIYQETAGRENFLIHPLSYYEEARRALVEPGFGKVFLAKYKGEPIAGIFLFNFGERVWYMYGASKSSHRELMPNHSLHWHVIEWAKKAGYKTYDLWGIPSNPSEGHPLFGVYRFKKGFNGKLVKFIGAYDLPFNKFMYHLIDNGINFWQNLRSLIKKGKIEDSLSE